MMIETAEFYIHISVWVTLTLIQGQQLFEKSKTSVCILSKMSQSIWVKFSLLPQPVVLFRLILNMFHLINIQWRELCLHDFCKGYFNTGLCLDT